eukprot:scaffold17899_cov112-Isochrysis_galbana.AAC.2
MTDPPDHQDGELVAPNSIPTHHTPCQQAYCIWAILLFTAYSRRRAAHTAPTLRHSDGSALPLCDARALETNAYANIRTRTRIAAFVDESFMRMCAHALVTNSVFAGRSLLAGQACHNTSRSARVRGCRARCPANTASQVILPFLDWIAQHVIGRVDAPEPGLRLRAPLIVHTMLGGRFIRVPAQCSLAEGLLDLCGARIMGDVEFRIRIQLWFRWNLPRRAARHAGARWPAAPQPLIAVAHSGGGGRALRLLLQRLDEGGARLFHPAQMLQTGRAAQQQLHRGWVEPQGPVDVRKCLGVPPHLQPHLCTVAMEQTTKLPRLIGREALRVGRRGSLEVARQVCAVATAASTQASLDPAELRHRAEVVGTLCNKFCELRLGLVHAPAQREHPRVR